MRSQNCHIYKNKGTKQVVKQGLMCHFGVLAFTEPITDGGMRLCRTIRLILELGVVSLSHITTLGTKVGSTQEPLVQSLEPWHQTGHFCHNSWQMGAWRSSKSLNKTEVLLGREKGVSAIYFKCSFIWKQQIMELLKVFLLIFVLFGLMSKDWFTILEVDADRRSIQSRSFGLSPSFCFRA